MSDRPLRLEWIEAGSLVENPHNWRRHPDGQMQALKDVIGDPEVGWAGACLFNERTGRLIDGHARRNAVDPSTPIPVLVGSWTEAAEKKILLTLDPLAGLATPDTDKLKELLDAVTLDTPALEALAAGLSGCVTADTEPTGEEWGEAMQSVPAGDRAPFQQMTFTLADEQAETVKAAIEKAKSLGAFVDTGNENSNGNALARICEAYGR